MAFTKGDNVDFFQMAVVVRDAYKSDLKKAFAKRNEAIERARKYCNSAGIKREVEKADSEYEKAVAKARFKVESEFLPILEEVEERETKKVQTIDGAKLSKVKMLADRNMTAEELTAVAKSNGFEFDYWCASYLRDIADNSGLTLEDLPNIAVSPTLDVKLSILDEIRSETEGMLQNYSPSEESTRDLAYLHDSHLTKWESQFTNGFRSASTLSDDAIVRRLFSKISGGWNETERGVAIREAMDQIPSRCRVALINKIAESSIITEISLNISGYGDEIRAFRDNGGTTEYKSAVASVQKFESAKNTSQELLDELGRMKDKPYFMDELRKSAMTSEIAKHYYEVANG